MVESGRADRWSLPVQRQMHDLGRTHADHARLDGRSSLGALGKNLGEWRDTDVGRELTVAADGRHDTMQADASLDEHVDEVRELAPRSPVEEHVHRVPRRDDVWPDSPKVLGRAVQLVEAFL